MKNAIIARETTLTTLKKSWSDTRRLLEKGNAVAILDRERHIGWIIPSRTRGEWSDAPRGHCTSLTSLNRKFGKVKRAITAKEGLDLYDGRTFLGKIVPLSDDKNAPAEMPSRENKSRWRNNWTTQIMPQDIPCSFMFSLKKGLSVVDSEILQDALCGDERAYTLIFAEKTRILAASKIGLLEHSGSNGRALSAHEFFGALRTREYEISEGLWQRAFQVRGMAAGKGLKFSAVEVLQLAACTIAGADIWAKRSSLLFKEKLWIEDHLKIKVAAPY